MCGRSPRHSGHDDLKTGRIKIIEYAVVANAAAPSRRLHFQTSDIAAEGVLAHRQQRGLNSYFIFCGEFFELFLGWFCYDEFPCHGEVHLRKHNPRARRPGVLAG